MLRGIVNMWVQCINILHIGDGCVMFEKLADESKKNFQHLKRTMVTILVNIRTNGVILILIIYRHTMILLSVA